MTNFSGYTVTRGILFDRTLLLVVWFPERERKKKWELWMLRSVYVSFALILFIFFCAWFIIRKAIHFFWQPYWRPSRLDDSFQEVILYYFVLWSVMPDYFGSAWRDCSFILKLLPSQLQASSLLWSDSIWWDQCWKLESFFFFLPSAMS